MSSPPPPIPYADPHTPDAPAPEILCLRDPTGVTFVGRPQPLRPALLKIALILLNSLLFLWMASFYFTTPPTGPLARYLHHPLARLIYVLLMLAAAAQSLAFALRTARSVTTPERLRADPALGLLVLEPTPLGLRRRRFPPDNVTLRVQPLDPLFGHRLARLIITRPHPRFPRRRRSTLFEAYPLSTLQHVQSTIHQTLHLPNAKPEQN